MNFIRKAYLTVLYKFGYTGHYASSIKGNVTWKSAWTRAGLAAKD